MICATYQCPHPADRRLVNQLNGRHDVTFADLDRVLADVQIVAPVATIRLAHLVVDFVMMDQPRRGTSNTPAASSEFTSAIART